jgi:hypothetical protein
MTITLYVTPKEVELPSNLLHRSESIQVVSNTRGAVTLELNDDLSVKEHIAALQTYIGSNYEISRKVPEPEACKHPIWDSVFIKPEPIMGLDRWCNSEAGDKSVFLPNDLLREGADIEEYVANAHYAGILINAYRTLCDECMINPLILTTGGQVLKARDLTPQVNSQYTILGSRSAKLANSKLVDFDDRPYMQKFIDILNRPNNENDAVRVRVLAKVEHILLGYTKHVYNQKFVQRFLEVVDSNEFLAHAEVVLAVIRSMIADNWVLETSAVEFRRRIYKSGLHDYADSLSTAFEACCGK